MHAFVDESLRMSGEGLYVVTAVVVTEDPDRCRDAIRSVLLPRQRRFHWRDESEAQRKAMLDALAALELPVYGYVRRPVPRRRQERARALCLNRMLWDLGQELAGAELVLETRQDRNDRKDRQTIIRAQKAGIAPPDLRYRFEHPGGEPLLWAADAAAGAVAGHLVEQGNYLDRLRDVRVEIVP
ncbi:MAG TPA: hypothetical protein VFA11_10025 [Acidimicrobiales bacterium]|nr:hypothetical protein [Acidimicrobiales bacterium]